MQLFYILPFVLIMMTPNDTRPVRLGNYLIDPANKTVSRFEYWESDDISHGERIHSWGEDCKVDTTIDFATTCLYLGDYLLVFKEHIAPVTYNAFDSNNNPVDMSGYKPFGKYFEKDGKYYYLINQAYGRQLLGQLVIKPNIDFAKLTPAGSNYYYDDRALYLIEDTEDDNQQLIKVANGNNCKPIMKKAYCVYNGVPYYAGVLALQNGAKKIDANPDDLVELDLWKEGDGHYIYLTDGKTFIQPSQLPQQLTMDIRKWKQLAPCGFLKVKNNCVYLPSPIIDNSFDNVYGVLFATAEGYLISDSQFKETKRYDKVFIFNLDTQQYEEIDVAQFELYIKGFHKYKGRLFYDGAPIATELDAPYLKNMPITGELDAANFRRYGNWLTDGKRLIHLDNKAVVSKDTYIRVSLGESVPIANAARLQMVYDKLLVDGVNLYLYTGRDIEVIPLRNLGVKVKINPPAGGYFYNEEDLSY